MNQFKAGDKIEHRPMPGFTMTVLGTRECEPADPARPEPHLMNELADEGTARTDAQAAAQADADGGGMEPGPLPPGVLGYAVGVFPGGAGRCSGLTHTSLMTAESAAREASQHAARARAEPVSAQHAECGYRPVEIRETSRG